MGKRNNRRRGKIRKLDVESLSERRLLASDLASLDTSADGILSALDVLLVVNAINGRSDYVKEFDTNSDGRLSSIDALMIVNAINEQPVAYQALGEGVAADAVDDIVDLSFVQRVTASNFNSLDGGGLRDPAGNLIGFGVNLDSSNVVPGVFGNALQFPQDGKFAQIDPTPSLNALAQNNADFSVSFWYRLDESFDGNYRTVLHKGVDVSGALKRTPGIFMRPNDNRLHVRLTTVTDGNDGLESNAALTVGQWTQITVVKQADIWALYLNGQLDSQITLSAASLGNDGPLYLGGRPGKPGALGAIDELEVFNKALAPAEIQLLQTQPQASYQFAQGNVAGNDQGEGALSFSLVDAQAASVVDLSPSGQFVFLATQPPVGDTLFTYQLTDSLGQQDLADVLRESVTGNTADAVDDIVDLSFVQRVTASNFNSLDGGGLLDPAGNLIGFGVNLDSSNVVPGVFGNALQFPQDGKFAQIDPTPSLNALAQNNADFSVSFWYRLDESFDGNYRTVLHKGVDVSGALKRTPGIFMRPNDNRLHVRLTTVTDGNDGLESNAALTVGQWTHITVVKQGDAWALYLNGQLDNQVTLASATLGNDGPLYLGGRPGKPGALGAIDELEVFNKALAPAEIQLLQTQPQASYQFAQGNVAGNDQGEGALSFSLVDAQAASVVDLSPSGQFVFLATQPPVGDTLFTYQLTDSLGQQDLANVLRESTSGIIADAVDDIFDLSFSQRVTASSFNSLDGGGLRDPAGNLIGFGVNLDSSNVVPGVFGNALQFPQDGKFAQIDPTPSLNALAQNNADFSVSFWYRLDESFDGNYRTVLHKGVDVSGALKRTPGIFMRPNDNRLHVRLTTVTDGNDGLESNAALTVGQWTQITVVKQADIWALYLNGQLDSQITLSAASLGNDGPLYLGGRPGKPGALGAIDELEVFNKALAPAEIQLLQTQPQASYQFAQGNVAGNDQGEGALSFSLVDAQAASVVDLSPSGQFVFLATQPPVGDTLFTYQLTDSLGQQDLADVLRESVTGNTADAVDDIVDLSFVQRVTASNFNSLDGGGLLDPAGNLIGFGVNLDSSNVVPGVFGNALQFPQDGKFAQIDPTPSLNALAQNNADFSVSFWYRLDESFDGNYRTVLHKGVDVSGALKRTPGIFMRPNDNRLHVRLTTVTDGNDGLESNAALTVGQWTQITVVKQADIWALYLNGQLDSQITLSAASLGNDGPLYLGGRPGKPGALGAIDELEVFNKALAPAEIQLLQTQPQASYQFAQGNVAGNDQGEGALSFSLVDAQAASVVDLSPSGQFVFLATQPPVGDTLFTYQLTDSLGQQDLAVAKLPPALSAGTGLIAEYFDNIDLTNSTLVRTDPTINFDWGAGSPDPALESDTFSIRWSGQIEPLYSETYNFEIYADDGVRLWVNDQLIIDAWESQSPTTHAGSIALTAAQLYPIRIEYFEDQNDAAIQLAWSSSSQTYETVPQSQLYEPRGFIGLVSNLINVDEANGIATVAVERRLGSFGIATFDYRTFAGTASEDIDFAPVEGSMTFLPGETVKNIDIPILGDEDIEVNETLSLTIDNVVGATLLVPRTATVNIVDDDTPLPSFSDFSDPSQLVLNGDATANAQRIRLVDASANQAGSLFFASALPVGSDTSFQSSFSFEIGADTGGSEGLTFVLQNSVQAADAIGNGGSELGYGGIGNSLAVEFDIHPETGELSDDHLSILTNGDTIATTESQLSPLDLNSGNPVFAWIDYSGMVDKIAVYLAGTPVKPEQPVLVATVSLDGLVGSQAFAGFTAATTTGVTHEILSWNLNTLTPSIPPTGQDLLDTTLISGLVSPTDLDWSDDNRNMLIAQKNGFVRVARDGVLLPTPFINISAIVNDTDDRGLLGIAVHPDFENHPFVYLAYAYDPPEVFSYTGLAGPDGRGNRAARVMRVTADATSNYTTAIAGSEVILLGTNSVWSNFNAFVDSTVNLSEPPAGINPDGTNIQDFIANDSLSHTLGSIFFGPDGALYVTVGDGTSYNQMDPRTVRVQDIDNLSGKVLRLDPLTGGGLTDNPFFNGDATANRSKVYQYGLRNPFRTTVNPATGAIFVGDVGWGRWEEINTAAAGANFGWPYYEGGSGNNLQTPVYQDLPEAQAFYASGSPTVAPIVAFSHQADGAVAIIAGDFYTGATYPAEYQGDLFIADVGEGVVRNLSFDASGNLSQVDTFLTNKYAIVQIVQAPDGNLYYVDLDDGTVGSWSFI